MGRPNLDHASAVKRDNLAGQWLGSAEIVR
jgi:hypothetical protein